MIKTRSTLFILVIALFFFSVTAGAQTLPDPDPDKASIAFGFSLKGMFSKFGSWTYEVYFVKVDDDGDLADSTEILTSGFYGKGRQAYLLNVEPGRYVAVGITRYSSVPAAEPRQGKPGHRSTGRSDAIPILFPEEIIALTDITAEPGQITFMAHLVGKSVTHEREGERAPDAVQRHYASVLGPRSVRAKIQGFRLIERKSEKDYWSQALENFRSEPPWLVLVRERLETLDGTE